MLVYARLYTLAPEVRVSYVEVSSALCGYRDDWQGAHMCECVRVHVCENVYVCVCIQTCVLAHARWYALAPEVRVSYVEVARAQAQTGIGRLR